MLGDNFRPWGELGWLLSKSNKLPWNIIGCISFEERCYGLRQLLGSETIAGNLYFDIRPPKTSYLISQSTKLQDNRRSLINSGLNPTSIIEVALMTSVDNFIIPLKKFIASNNGNVILDISCFPKRFFFPILKTLLNSSSVQNVIVTYTKPEKYTQDELSGDPSEWSHIPGGFMSKDFPEPDAELAIISVGFMPLGLTKLLTGKYRDAKVKLLFPHPPGPPNYQRNWDFVKRIVDSYPPLNLNDMIRVHALDVGDAFDRICTVTNKGEINSILAPYGPKPISLAMALFAIQTGAPVYYTQPNYYSPEYSSGIRETVGYWIQKSSKILYQV
jgi:hypothetical protein